MRKGNEKYVVYAPKDKNKKTRVGNMAQELRAMTAHPKILNSFLAPTWSLAVISNAQTHICGDKFL